MAYGDITLKDNDQFEATYALMPWPAKVSDTMVVVVYRGEGADPKGYAKTINIDSNGDITLTGEDLIFDTVNGSDPCIMPVEDATNMFVVSYQGDGLDGWMKTFTVNPTTGAMTLTGYSWEYETVRVMTSPCISHLTGNLYAVTWPDPDFDGQMKTFTINPSTGEITASGYSWEFDTTQGINARIIPISADNDLYAVVYKSGGAGIIKTCTIDSSTGEITATGYAIQFDADGDGPTLLQTGNYWTIVYAGPDSDGWAKTMTIDSTTGEITLTGQSYEWDNTTGATWFVSCVSVGKDGTDYILAIPYKGNDLGGYLKTIRVQDDGTFNGTQDTDHFWPTVTATGSYRMLHLCVKSDEEDLYVITYEDSSVRGKIQSLAITTPPSAAAAPIGGLPALAMAELLLG